MVEKGLGLATWVKQGRCPPLEAVDGEGQGRECLRRATQVKNIWVPYGEWDRSATR